MNPTAAQSLTEAFTLDLQEYLKICESALVLSVWENRTLTAGGDYSYSEFHQQRKNLLPNLETALIKLQSWRATWQQVSPEIRAGLADARALFQKVQELLMKIVLLDRDNQQALLRRGLVPAEHLPRAASQPHFVAGLYKRHLAD